MSKIGNFCHFFSVIFINNLSKNRNIFIGVHLYQYIMVIFDISQLAEQNPWWVDKTNILKDYKLSGLNKLQFQWDPHIRHYIKLNKDVIYTIRGPRQVGKTTLIKIITSF